MQEIVTQLALKIREMLLLHKSKSRGKAGFGADGVGGSAISWWSHGFFICLDCHAQRQLHPKAPEKCFQLYSLFSCL